MSNTKKTGDVDIKVVMLDELAGQERYDSLSSFYCRHTNVALICYNVTDESTFHNIQKWYHKLETSVPAEDCFVILVGTKSDLGKPVITEKKVEDLISNNRLIYKHFVTSAKDGTNVSTIFDTIAEEYERRKATNQNRRSSIGMVPISQLQTNSDTSLKKGCCG
ncbi:hypothetical protein FDP41_004532 [Naegleria fowleri]|uniref:Uncharacterized protein n=1 Tax=Naegleria fowleri TaxID=5763 RepID=A0A6A5BFL8_NAEFO|nr:uncharacterized protein FDP41_004532 [Naegleria fowleri]KAF0976633.1 hypothetical protein FDP41_004532 [Naegleria fowleri]